MVTKSKTAQAVALYLANRNQGMTVYQAAKEIGVDAASVYRRLGKLSAMAGKICPCCGQLVPPAVTQPKGEGNG